MGFSGVGLGLRHPHLAEVAALDACPVPFWEIAPENVIGQGGRVQRWIRQILERDPVLTHGLSMSMGGTDRWDRGVVKDLAAFLKDADTPFHSEHLCWSSFEGAATHELLPLPWTWEAMRHTIRRVKRLQAALPVPLLLENISHYLVLGAPQMDEAQFLSEILEGADCGWLLDVNNLYVNSQNHGFDPKDWLLRTPLHRVRQMHIAGHRYFPEDGCIIDTHGEAVIDPVIDLMAFALERIGHPVPVLLERDNEVPSLAELLQERERIQQAYDLALAPIAVCADV